MPGTTVKRAVASVALALWASGVSAQTNPSKTPGLDDIIRDAAKTPAAPDVPRATRAPVMPLVPLSADEFPAILNKIRPCWLPPSPLAGFNKGVAVTITGIVGTDGHVISAKVAEEKRMSDATYAAHANAALRAVNNHRCQPWPLVAQRRGGDRGFSLTFDPRWFQR